MLEIAVTDDGSEANLEDVVEQAALPFEWIYERQEFVGNGAGPARNLGTARTTSEVVVFLDSDCIPAPDLVERHTEWHRRAANAVVVGNRLDVDADGVGVEEIAERFTDLASTAGLHAPTTGLPFQGWRGVLHRRSKGMLIGDTAYRACLSNNLSMRRGFLEHVGLIMEVVANRDQDQINVMTLHSAKGLEFDTVFLAGWEEGLFPNQRALDEHGMRALEEERRLAYVGLTRARERVVVSFVANRRLHGSWTPALPSRFVDELPKEHVEVEAEPGRRTSCGVGIVRIRCP